MRVTECWRTGSGSIPQGAQEELLRTLELCRRVYNWALECLNSQKKLNLYEFKRELPKLKEVYSQVLQNEVLKLFHNLRALASLKRNGRRVGKLRFI